MTIIWEIWNKRNLFTKKYDCLRKRKLCMTIIILYFNDLFSQRRSSLMYVYFCFFYSLLWSGGNARCLLDRQPYALVVWFLNSEELLFKRSRNLFILKSIDNFFFQKKENLDSLGALKIKSISDPLRIKRKKKTDQRGLTPLGDALTT